MTAVLERGDLFFFYRPRVGQERVDGLEDVQRLFLILEPDGSGRFRRIVVGRKRLPDPERHERAWAFVVEVVDRPSELREELGRREYDTRTRGRRVEAEARPAGEARYLLARHERHTHLAYALELPREPGEAQRALNIEPQASLVVAVKNPEAPTPPGAGLGRHRAAAFPPELLERFRGRRFIPVDPPAFLDYEGAELVLIGAAEDPADELGVPLDAEAERLDSAELFRALGVRPGELPVEPLERGELR